MRKFKCPKCTGPAYRIIKSDKLRAIIDEAIKAKVTTPK